MKLYIKQKVFSLGDKFLVYDENGNDRYYVEGEVFSFGKKLHMYTLNGREVCYIHQRPFSFRPTFGISMNGSDIARVVREYSIFYQHYTIDGFGWEADGDFFNHEYRIMSSYGTVAWITKKWFTWGDTYEIDVSERFSEVLALSTVLVIDAVLALSNR